MELYKVSFSDAEVDSCLKEANTDSKVNSADPHPFTALKDVSLDRFEKVMFILSLNIVQVLACLHH